MILVVLVLLWGYPPFKAKLDAVSMPIQWPGLHNLVQRMPPVVAQPSKYGAVFNFQWLSASGTACLFTAILGAMVVGLSPLQFLRSLRKNGPTTSAGRADARSCRGSGLCHELFGRHRNARSGVRRNRGFVSHVQFCSWFSGSLPDRKRHLRQRAVRHTSGSDGNKTGYESGV